MVPFRLGMVGAVLCGALYCLAFPGIDMWPLAFVAFAPLWVAIQGQPPKRALLLGLVAGTTMNVGGFYWLQNMLATFSGFPWAICAFFTLVVCTYQGGRLALMGWLYARAAARGWPAALVFVAAFIASELVYPLLFPWYFAACLHGQTPMIQLAELGGPILVGLVPLLTGMALGELLRARRSRRRIAWGAPVVAGSAVGATLLYGFLRVPAVDARSNASEAVHVGIVQGNMELLRKREDPAEGLRRHLRLTSELREKGAELVVWSESSATFPMRENMYKASMQQYVGRYLGIPAIVGGVIYRFDPDRERFFNVALSMDASGAVQSRYDKQFLLAFGEHLPFSETFPILQEWSPNSGRFTPGTSLEPLTITVRGKEHKASTLICYEDILPSFTNTVVRHADPELLVNITNDAWFGDTTEPWEHLGLAQFRSVEHRRWLVRSTNSGVSAVVDPAGRVVAHGGTFRAETVDATVHLMRGSTVYEKVRDVPWWIVTATVGLGAFVRRKRA